MGLIASDKGGSDFEPLPAGSYVARCVSVVDIGVQPTGFGDKEKVYLGFEVPSERVEWEKDGQKHEGPAFIGSRYTLSISPKSILGQHLTSWRGVPFTDEERQGFDLFTVLGAPCMINVIHTQKNDKTYANIEAIMRLPKGITCPNAESELVAYTPLDNEHAGNFDKLQEWQQRLVRQGYKMAEGSTTIGSALAAEQAAGGPIAPNQPPPQVPQTAREQALATAGVERPHPESQPPADYFDDDIPF